MTSRPMGARWSSPGAREPRTASRSSWRATRRSRSITAEAELTAAAWTLPPPERSGRYCFRYRSIEPDGFVSPYSCTLTIEVPRDWSGMWLLLPLLLLL